MKKTCSSLNNSSLLLFISTVQYQWPYSHGPLRMAFKMQWYWKAHYWKVCSSIVRNVRAKKRAHQFSIALLWVGPCFLAPREPSFAYFPWPMKCRVGRIWRWILASALIASERSRINIWKIILEASCRDWQRVGFRKLVYNKYCEVLLSIPLFWRDCILQMCSSASAIWAPPASLQTKI